MGRSTKGIDYQDVPRPVSALADDYPSGYLDPRHSHPRGQLIYATTGVMTVTTDQASFVVPPQRAVWVPHDVEHEAFCRGRVACRTLYIDTSKVDGLPAAARVIEVSDLLRELIVEATRVPIEYDESSRDGRLMRLIVDEIIASQTAPLHVPMPQDPRLARICAAILQDPAQNDVLDDWADRSAMGRRTFTRAFRRETGMSFAEWRQNVRLMEAMSLLATGHSVTRVAFDVGYSSPSAFTAMFRRMFGAPPTHYLSDVASERPA
ncbi:MAG TPA: helix-turn-helix transcriptional regulator [Caulobacteraceae bacterium]|jgi:AraC-like DNA-binding protein|nr:helix-turn-helix transcriptional regulator [Caulobacteraceae bacterium]